MSLFSSIWKDLEYGFKMGNMVRKLILVNILIFVLVQILHLGCNIATAGRDISGELFWRILNYLAMPSDWRELLWHIWTPITSMFLHEGFWHLLGNMIWLSIFGTIVGDLIGDRRVLPIYLLGGLSGGVMYFLSANLMPAYIGSHALGASAAVMAFGATALILNPEYRIALMFLGEVKLKYIVLIMVLLDLVGVSGMSNSGGHAAHIGGFIFGVLFVYALRDRKDWSEPVNDFLSYIGNFLDNIWQRIRGNYRPQMRVTHKRRDAAVRQQTPPRTNTNTKGNSSSDVSHQEQLDLILDKIKQKGFDQLTQEEKDFLYEASKK